MHNETSDNGLSKVPEVTFIFWVIKVAATTLGDRRRCADPCMETYLTPAG
jgi:uncharacterized membrane-anchored protein